jgi:hypothetical protein
MGHPTEPGFSFCGAERPFDRSYCDQHHDKGYKHQPLSKL